MSSQEKNLVRRWSFRLNQRAGHNRLRHLTVSAVCPALAATTATGQPVSAGGLHLKGA